MRQEIKIIRFVAVAKSFLNYALNNMQLYYIFIFILLSVMTGPVLGLDTCDPLRFYLHTSKDGNCPSATIFFMSSPFTLEIDAEMGDNCNVRNQKSISLVFSDQTGSPFLQRDYPEEEYYFEYSIRWDEPRSHCIVDLVPDTSADPNWMMMDQNGILNNPYENLEPHAYKKVYTRKFILDSKSPTRFRMAFTCSRDPSATAKPEQRAFIYSIKFGPVNKLKGADLILYKPAGKEYDCWRNVPKCNSEPPHKNASCVWVQTEEEPLSMWYYKGSWYMEEAVNRPVSVPGNLFVDNVMSTVGASGCIKPWHQDDITIGLRPDWPVDLVQSSKCKIPLYTIEERQRGLDVPQVFPYPRRGCKYSLKHDSIKRVSSGTTGTLSLLAPKAGWYLDCRKDKPQEQDVDRTQTDQRQQQTETKSNSHTGLVILISMVIAAIVLYKRHQRNRNQPRVRLFAPTVV